MPRVSKVPVSRAASGKIDRPTPPSKLKRNNGINYLINDRSLITKKKTRSGFLNQQLPISRLLSPYTSCMENFKFDF